MSYDISQGRAANCHYVKCVCVSVCNRWTVSWWERGEHSETRTACLKPTAVTAQRRAGRRELGAESRPQRAGRREPAAESQAQRARFVQLTLQKDHLT